MHATQCLPCTCTARGYHALVDLIPSTLRRSLRSLSEIPSTLRRNLRSIAVSFFLPCEHNNRKADRIAFLNSRSYAEDVTSVTSGASQGPHSFNLVFVCLFVSRLALSRICPVPYRTAGHLLAPVSVPYRTVPSNTAGYKQLATILCTCIRLPVCCNCA